jgi:hypothetical protein
MAAQPGKGVIFPDQEQLILKFKVLKQAMVKVKISYGNKELSLWEFSQK